MPKCENCGYQEPTGNIGRTISFIMGSHPDARDPSKTCLGGKLIKGIRDPDSDKITWLDKPVWKPAVF